MKRFGQWVERNEIIIVILCVTLLLKIPSWFEPYWYGDEAIYLTIGNAINHGVKLYSQIHDNKPPLLYLVAAVANGNEFWFKFLATVSVLVTIVVFYNLARKIFENKNWSLVATGLFAMLLSWPKIEGNIANAELFFLLPSLMAAIVLWEKNPRTKNLWLGGLLYGLAALFKVPAIIEIGVWPLIWMVNREKRWWSNVFWLGLGALTPLLVSCGYFAVTGGLKEYIIAAWAQNIPYLGSWKSSSQGFGIYSLSGRVAVLSLVLAVVFGLTKRWGRRATILAGWLMLGLFAALLSGRPYPHYLLQISGVLCLAGVGILFLNKWEKVILGITVILVAAGIWSFHFYSYRTWDYFGNFVSWTWGNKSTEEYLNWFDPQTVNNYKVAALVKVMTQPGDEIFVWGDEPMIYAISSRIPTGKYTVKYHILDFSAQSQTMNSLRLDKPKLIVSYGQNDLLPGFEDLLRNSYRVEALVGKATIFRRSLQE